MFTEETLRACVVLKKLLHFDLMIYGFPVCAKFNTARKVFWMIMGLLTYHTRETLSKAFSIEPIVLSLMKMP